MKDSFSREINYLRISVTDRCNLRCRYCIPGEVMKCRMSELLTYEEIEMAARAAVSCGITRFKITGGEPLVRLGVEELIAKIVSLPGTEQVTLTTNGILLEEKLPALIRAGLCAVNISLDTLDREQFQRVTGSDQIDAVLRGLRASLSAGIRTKINAVLAADRADIDFDELTAIAREQPVDVRFIELMPIGEGKHYAGVDNTELIRRLIDRFPGAELETSPHGNGPAVYYALPGYAGRIGFISAMHGKFCGSCNRLRLTSTGFLKPCLCYEDGVDLRDTLRSRKSPDEITAALEESFRKAIQTKPRAHIFETPQAVTEKKLMSGIGG